MIQDKWKTDSPLAHHGPPAEDNGFTQIGCAFGATKKGLVATAIEREIIFGGRNNSKQFWRNCCSEIMSEV